MKKNTKAYITIYDFAKGIILFWVIDRKIQKCKDLRKVTGFCVCCLLGERIFWRAMCWWASGEAWLGKVENTHLESAAAPTKRWPVSSTNPHPWSTRNSQPKPTRGPPEQTEPDLWLVTIDFCVSKYVQTLENTTGLMCFKHHARVRSKIKIITN